jgi:hypothetical protein
MRQLKNAFPGFSNLGRQDCEEDTFITTPNGNPKPDLLKQDKPKKSAQQAKLQ